VIADSLKLSYTKGLDEDRSEESLMDNEKG